MRQSKKKSNYRGGIFVYTKKVIELQRFIYEFLKKI